MWGCRGCGRCALAWDVHSKAGQGRCCHQREPAPCCPTHCCPREGDWLWEGVGEGSILVHPECTLSLTSLLSAHGPQQNPELYRWQPAPTQDWPPQLQALPERDRQEGEAAQEVAGRWVKPEGCGERGGSRTFLLPVSIAGCPVDPSTKGWGELLGCRDPWELLCGQLGHGGTMKPAPSCPQACETAVFWGDTAGGLAIGRKSQWKDGGQRLGDIQGLVWSRSSQPTPGSRLCPAEGSQSSLLGGFGCVTQAVLL